MKIHEIDTESLQTKFISRGATTVKVMLLDDVKRMATEYEKLPPIHIELQKESRFSRILAGLILCIRRRYELDIEKEDKL